MFSSISACCAICSGVIWSSIFSIATGSGIPFGPIPGIPGMPAGIIGAAGARAAAAGAASLAASGSSSTPIRASSATRHARTVASSSIFKACWKPARASSS